MTHARLSAVLLAALASAGTASAEENMTCADRSLVVSFLEDQHGEERTFSALNEKGDQVFVYLNKETGSWTALLRPKSAPDILCAMDNGSAGRLDRQDLPPPA